MIGTKVVEIVRFIELNQNRKIQIMSKNNESNKYENNNRLSYEESNSLLKAYSEKETIFVWS